MTVISGDTCSSLTKRASLSRASNKIRAYIGSRRPGTVTTSELCLRPGTAEHRMRVRPGEADKFISPGRVQMPMHFFSTN